MEALVRGFSHLGVVGGRGLSLGVGLAGFRFPCAGEYVLWVALWGAVGVSWPGGSALLLAGSSILGEYHKSCDDKDCGLLRVILKRHVPKGLHR